jgi:hypothetical protein
MAEEQSAENGGSLLEGNFADWGRTDCVGAIDEGIGVVKGAGWIGRFMRICRFLLFVGRNQEVLKLANETFRGVDGR